jgi:ATP/maltotriose-dependent transcriptional regulator MalT
MQLDDPVISFNAAVLRARFLLALQRTEQAQETLMIDDSRPVSPAMRAELIAMRALTSAVLGDFKEAEVGAQEASAMTTAVEVRGYVEATYAVCRPGDATAANAFSLAEQLDVWDPLVSAMRAHPPLLGCLAQSKRRRARLQTLLRRCNDFDLARSAAIPVGTRPRMGPALLSPREREVFELVCEGLTNKQIAQLLFISAGTAKVHVHHILEKLGVRSRTEAVARFSLEDD